MEQTITNKNKNTAQTDAQSTVQNTQQTAVSQQTQNVNQNTSVNQQAVGSQQTTPTSVTDLSGNTYNKISYEEVTPSIKTTAPNIQKLNNVDTSQYEEILKKQIDTAGQQQNAQIDNTVRQSTNELQRQYDDAKSTYQEQYNQINAEEKNALDNSALYAELRGDRGGIGQAQYNSIQNTAAQNRLSVQNAQQKLATDTNRQISDLRAQGEFQKADALLTLTQNYLSQLMSIKQWADELNLSVAQTNLAIDQWKAEYEQNAAQYVDSIKMQNAENKYNADSTWQNTLFSVSSTNRSELQSTAQTKLQNGDGNLSADELSAMGMTAEQAMKTAEYYKTVKDLEIESAETDILAAKQDMNLNARKMELTEAEYADSKNNNLADSAYTKLKSGIMPNDNELNAAGITRSVAEEYLSGSGTEDETEEEITTKDRILMDAYLNEDMTPEEYINKYYADYGYDKTQASALVEQYNKYTSDDYIDDFLANIEDWKSKEEAQNNVGTYLERFAQGDDSDEVIFGLLDAGYTQEQLVKSGLDESYFDNLQYVNEYNNESGHKNKYGYMIDGKWYSSDYINTHRDEFYTELGEQNGKYGYIIKKK